MIPLDTNLVSEVIKTRLEEAVFAWLNDLGRCMLKKRVALPGRGKSGRVLDGMGASLITIAML
jgi:hypothetical protein